MFRHIIPNAIGTILVNVTFQIADAILLVTYVSFLGLGVPPPSTNWGAMLSKGITYTYDGYGNLASVTDPRSGHVLPALAQVALEEGETVARNLAAELEGTPLEAFAFHDKGFVLSVGTRRGVADVAGITSGGRLAHLLKDAIEWEYRQSVRHLRGWDPLAG